MSLFWQRKDKIRENITLISVIFLPFLVCKILDTHHQRFAQFDSLKVHLHEFYMKNDAHFLDKCEFNEKM